MSEIAEKFKYLIDKAEYFQKLKDKKSFLFDEIVKLSIENIKEVQKFYINEEKIKKIRYEVGNLLINNNFNKDSFEELKKDINDQYDTNILQAWKDFSILYVFFFNPIKIIVNQYLEDIGNYLIEKSGVKLKLKTTNFDGAQNFGEVGCWIALYNPKHKSQSEGIQYFINFFDNNTTYGTYEHQNKRDIDRKKYDVTSLNDNVIEVIVGDIQKQANIILEKNNNQMQENGEDDTPKGTKRPLNQILYGPPGTGKTYKTINKALKIIDGVVPDDRTEAKAKFEEYKKAGQIEFVTFHQSYGYEEFVEGIKADLENDGIKYKLEEGVLQNISRSAEKNYSEFHILKNQKKDTLDITKLINDFANFVQTNLAGGIETVLFQNKNNTKALIGSVKTKNDGSLQSFLTSGSVKDQSLTVNVILRDYQDYLDGKIKSYTDIRPSFESQSNYHGNAIYYYELYRLLKEFQNKTNYKYELKHENPKLKNYILIIDEINRGNISKIFGELITLIEPSKRIGADEEIRVKLPYSGDEFGVPQNLYIVGTMNTADRSIAPIDTALRRRFVFEEMAPNSSLLTKEKTPNIYTDVDLKKLLEAINTRIEYLYDRDHTIGHAYLIDVKTLDDLRFAFKNKIIPLLAEYFYEDWENIKLVLDDNENKFITVREKGNHPALSSMDKNYNKKLYSVNDIDSLSAEDFISIYPKA